jgi:hypothetical protein
MASPFRLHRTFVDADGVHWGVEARLVGEGSDAIPVEFGFTSQHGEHRALHGAMAECVSCDQFGDADWRAVLLTSHQVTASKRRGKPPTYLFVSIPHC